MSRRIRITLEYDGTLYHGWQKQENAASIQQTVEEKLAILLGEKAGTTVAGRTDTGVHARGQVAAFSTKSRITTARMLAGLNGLLPDDIRVTDCREAPEVFDPRRDALGKTYRYTWLNRPVASAFWSRYSWHIKTPMQMDMMREALAVLKGRHDFAAFRASDCDAKTTVRELYDVDLKREDDLVHMTITGTAFLHQMVRIIAGTVCEIGMGRRKALEMKKVLESKNRIFAGRTAPARGLVLWEVQYGEIPRPGRKVMKKPVDEA